VAHHWASLRRSGDYAKADSWKKAVDSVGVELRVYPGRDAYAKILVSFDPKKLEALK